LAGDARARVAVGARRFQVDLVAGADHVHAVARSAGDPPATLSTVVARLPEPSVLSDAGRWLAIAALSRPLAVAPEALAIDRDGRIPMLRIRGERCAADLSLSHHGRFVAFACALR